MRKTTVYGMDERYSAFANMDMSRYTGKWVAIVDNDVVSYGEDVKTVYNNAVKSYPKKRPLLARVPANEILIL